MPRSRASDLVIAAAAGYEFAQVRPFFASLRASGYAGRVRLFVSGLADATLTLLANLGAEIEPVDPGPGRLSVTRTRFFHALRFLESAPEPVGRVLLADVRDVVFQRDPFDFDPGGSVCCFEEEASIPLRSSPINAGWVRQAFGQAVLDEIGDDPPCCVGTVFAPCSLMVEYLKRLTGLLSDIRPDFFSSDQAAHIYMVRKGLVPCLRLFGNDHGPVLTLGTKPAHSVRVNDQGEVVNDDGEVVPVLHQYDRHPVLQALLRRRFG